MAFDPGAPIVVKVEINAGALGWVDITGRGRAASCDIRQGRTGGAIQAEPSRLQLTLGNSDGYLTEDNAVSPYYGSWGRGCEIRVSRIGLAVSPAERFHGQIDTIVERYPGGNMVATVEVTAVGTLGILTQGSDPLRSPLYRTMAGITAGDFLSVAYWSCEDGSGSTQFASSFPGQAPAQIKGSVTPASYTGFPGSSALPVLNSSGQIVARFPAYTSTGVWQAQYAFVIPGDIVDKNLFEVTLVPEAFYARLMASWDTATNMLRITAYSQDGAQVDSNVGGTGVALTPGTPYIGAITELASGPDRYSLITVRDTAGTLTYQTQMVGSGGAVAGKPTQIRAIADSVSAGLVFGHVSLYTDPGLVSVSAIQPNALAAGGFLGEKAGDRMDRLCREEGVAFTLTGSAADTQPMGPQLIDTLVANLRDCETADQGLMHDNGTDGAVGYVTLTHLFNQTATLAVVNGSLEPDLEAIRDNQYARNDITSSRPNSDGSAHVTDEAHVAKVRARLKDTRQPNVQTDAQLPNDAGWAVHVGVAPGARYNAVGINLRNPYGALLADQVAAHAIGDRLTIAKTALPPQHDIGGIDGLTVGWTEVLDVDTWKFRANLVPYWPYAVGVYGTARYDSSSTTTAEVLDTTETGVDIAVTAGSASWPTTAANPSQFPFDINIGGERMSVTAITSTGASTYTMTVTRSVNGVVKSHASGVPVHIWQPAFYTY
jgi:hypothetical protein